MPTHSTVSHISIPFTQIAPQIHDGIKFGVDRQWNFAKELLCIKPEYLLTVSVADELSRQLCLQTRVALEETTKDVVFAIRMSALGWTDYFAQKSLWNGRRGKVDIFLSRNASRSRMTPTEVCVVELKNLDPPKVEIVKDIKRLISLLMLTPAASPMNVGYLAFPSRVAMKDALQDLAVSCGPDNIVATVEDAYVPTGEDPEDGIPAFYSNVLMLCRTKP